MPDIFEKVDRELHLFSQFQTPGNLRDSGTKVSKLKVSPQSSSRYQPAHASRNSDIAAHYFSDMRSNSRFRNDTSFITQHVPHFGSEDLHSQPSQPNLQIYAKEKNDKHNRGLPAGTGK